MTSTATEPSTGLEVFRDPSSVTVLGASADPTKWGYWLARGALKGRGRRAVHLVNRHGGAIDGHDAVSSLDAVEAPLDLVVLCVPPLAIEDAVEEALRRGARGFLGITAGINRALGDPDAERRLAQRIRDRGARIVGPNCMGIYDAATDLQLAWGEFHAGSLGIVSQSGQLGSELSELAAERGLGVSRFVSVGNQVDVHAAEVLGDLVDHDQTRVIALYVESFADGRALIDTVHRLREQGKHTILLTVGASAASRTAAQSHTGSMTSAMDVVDAACHAAGAIRVATPNEVVEVAHMLVASPPMRGRRVAIVGDSGGQGAVAADVLGAQGLDVAPLSTAVRDRLGTLLPPDAGLANPIDLAGAGEQDLDSYARIIEELLAVPEVDAVALTGYYGSYGHHTPAVADHEQAVARRIAAAVHEHAKPVALHSMCRQSNTISLIRELGVPTYHTIETAALALGSCARLTATPGRLLADVPNPVTGDPVVGYLAARELLRDRGVRFPAARRVADVDQVRAAAAELAAPYVLKADWLLHKTEVGGVAVGLADTEAAVASFTDMTGRLGAGDYVLEEMDTRPDVVELLVGARRDPSFGPVVMVGAGGVLAEMHRDSALELAPVDATTATAMRDRLRARPLLEGWRGRPPVDVAGLDQVVTAMSRILVARPDLAEVEVNPLRVGADGAIAVDALVTALSSPSDQSSPRVASGGGL